MDFKKFINSFDGVFEGIAASNWLLSVGVAVLSFIVIHGVLVLCRCRLKKIKSDEHSSRPVAELLSGTLAKTSNLVVVVTALLIGLTVLDLPQPWADRVKHLWFITLGLQIGFWLNQLITICATRYFKRHGESEAQPTVARTLMGWGMKTVLWVVLLLAMLSNLGINISAFVASLGIGGVAVALAVQNILGDLFASLSIAVDKPFEVGDAISVNGFSGSVEHVGLKTTRIRADSGEQIVIANADLLKNTVRNFKRMQNRRVQFSLNLDPATPVSVAEGIPAALRRVVERQDTVRFDRAHLKNVTQDALEFEVVYFVLNPSYGVFMDTQQRILLAAMKLVDEVGASVSRPSQRVLVDSAEERDKEAQSARTLRYLKK
ncbi:mechanosensitive ion channel family protein [Pseudoduganella namucuonensis]|uniref:Small-conductance mechanosensitive channel n=1 Tax=Pseudoduganella namucuonensis TaxID=1035707 RepID=A0A1I7M3A5_9BURK|nr:mechanosensitive ion channel family protein [Pseudoduganella namucuonensis]SFV16436.1 Small-conductance mechanosensitive channel [Pseudoduganella namucuonensis]